MLAGRWVPDRPRPGGIIASVAGPFPGATFSGMAAARTLYDKLWDDHVVHVEEDGTTVLYVDRHLVHEVTSPQAFEGLRLAGRKPWRISSVVATADHNTPTTDWDRGYEGIADPVSKEQIVELDNNIRQFGAAAYFTSPLSHETSE